MTKYFTEAGFLNKEGERLLLEVRDALSNVMSQDDVHDMTDDELRVLGSNLTKMVGDAISKAFSQRLQFESKMNAMTDEQFYAYLKEKYGDSWTLHSVEPVELKRVPPLDWEKILKDNKYVGEEIRKFAQSNGVRFK